MAQPHHVLLVAFPAQGFINPTIQLAKRLISLNVRVTFMSTDSAINRMNKDSSIEGLSFTSFSDEDLTPEDQERYIMGFERCGSQTLKELISSNAKQGMPFDHIVYSLLFPWVARVAREFQVPSTFLWIQPASIMSIYHSYCAKDYYGDIIRKNIDDSSFSFELPGFPVTLNNYDLPSFFLPSSPHKAGLELLRMQLEILDGETKPKVLVNTFDDLEPIAFQAFQKYNMVGIGPLIPSAFLDGKNPRDTSFGGDLFEGSKDNYIKWLDSMPHSSVVYVSFGSLAVLEKAQKDEIARGLIATGFPFLWVVRDSEQGDDDLSCKEELEKQGMIVPWCSQVEVLSHPSVGCFLTHCGWNSTLESLASGVPMVAFPQWSDQGTNSKLVQDVWETGIRVTKNGKGLVENEEIKKCLELVMRNDKMRENTKKWKDLAKMAVMEGGSSYNNIKAFVDDLGKKS